MAVEAANLLDCNPIRVDVDADTALFTFYNDHDLVLRLFLRFCLDASAPDAVFPFRNTRELPQVKNKLLFVAKELTKKKDIDKYKTRANIRELQCPDGKSLFVIADDISRDDEISFALCKVVLEASVLDDDGWYESEDELARTIDFMIEFEKTILLDLLKKTVALRAYFKRSLEMVRRREVLEKADDAKKEKILKEFSSVSGNQRYLIYPYCHVLAHLCGHLRGIKVLERTELITAIIAVNQQTVMDTQVAVNHDGFCSERVWLLLAGVKMICSLRARPHGYSSLSIILNSLVAGKAVYTMALAELHSTLVMLRCHSCTFITSQRKVLIRHIMRMHRRLQDGDASAKMRKMQQG